MGIEVTADYLADRLDKVKQIVSNKSLLPILQNVLLTTKKGKLYLYATNLDIAAMLELNVQVSEEIEMLLSYQKLYKLLKAAGDSLISIEENNKKIVIKTLESNYGKFKSTINTLSVEDYPAITPVETSYKLEVDTQEFLDKLKKVSISQPGAGKSMGGVFMSIYKDKLELAATDGHSLAIESLQASNNTYDKDQPFTKEINPDFFKIMQSLDDAANIQISVNDKHIKIKQGVNRYRGKFIDKEPLEYSTLIPKKVKYHVIFDRHELMHQLQLAAPISDEVTHCVVLSFGDQLSLKAESEAGRSDVLIDYNKDSKINKGYTISINHDYLMRVLKVLESDMVKLNFQEDNEEAIALREDRFIYIFMPIS